MTELTHPVHSVFSSAGVEGERNHPHVSLIWDLDTPNRKLFPATALEPLHAVTYLDSCPISKAD